jgi:hypothetical protein
MRAFFVSIMFLGLMLCASVAFGAGIPDPIADPGGFLSGVLGAFSARDWILVSAFVTYLVVALVRSQRARVVALVPWFSTRFGGYVLAVGVAALSALALGLAGHLPARDLAQQIVVDALAAIGFYQATKDAKAKA